MAADTEPLFSHFLVVRLTESQGGGLKPEIKFQRSTRSGEQLLKTCVNFCFPALEDAGRTTWPASESFTYTLTEDDGTRLFGYCRRLLEPPRTLPDAICILTRRQWSSFYAHMLDILQLHYDLAAFVPPFIDAVARTPAPRAGTACIVSPWGASGESFRLHAPDESMPAVASFELLFTTLGTVNVIRLVAALVHESRVVIIGARLSDVSTVAHSAAALLAPFTWQHVFIPVLPTSMIDYVCAPMPFVVGVLEAHRPLLQQQPMEQCVFVELDRGKLRGDDDVPQLPRPSRDALFRRLEALKSARSGHPRYDPRQVTDAFLSLFAEVLHDYREFVHEGKAQGAREQVEAARRGGGRQPRIALDELFDHAGFVDAQPKEAQPFIASLRGVQMWEAWLSDALLTPADERSARPFDRRLVDVAARFATLPGPLDGKPKLSSKERAREAVVGLRFAIASATTGSVPAPARLLGVGARAGPGAGGMLPAPSQQQQAQHHHRAEQVAAAVVHARAAGAQQLHAAQARARTVASSLRERSAQLAVRRAGSAGQDAGDVEADEFLATIVVHTNDAGAAEVGDGGKGGAARCGARAPGGGAELLDQQRDSLLRLSTDDEFDGAFSPSVLSCAAAYEPMRGNAHSYAAAGPASEAAGVGGALKRLGIAEPNGTDARALLLGLDTGKAPLGASAHGGLDDAQLLGAFGSPAAQPRRGTSYPAPSSSAFPLVDVHPASDHDALASLFSSPAVPSGPTVVGELQPWHAPFLASSAQPAQPRGGVSAAGVPDFGLLLSSPGWSAPGHAQPPPAGNLL
ncbi:hypothetical protein KFE25_000997 [Diacronema lutheri]|uniref:UDENN domain-containing protein n=2 Tax=Diacronema lutheri TaxID=2081491 RepID=A0A8J5X328_DIALT|nr:hypothetical protein KFE25_000997 [Diacronema lutheri]